MQFLSSDLISSPKFQNRWEYDSLLKLSVGIRPRHSSWSVLLLPCLLVVSLTLGRSAIQYSMILLAIMSDFSCVKSSRSLRPIPSNTHHHNILPLSSHASDFHNLQPSHDVDQCNVLLTYNLVSPSFNLCAEGSRPSYQSSFCKSKTWRVFNAILNFSYHVRVRSYILSSDDISLDIQNGIVSTYLTDKWIVRTHFLEQSLQSNVLMGSIWTHFENSTPPRIVHDGSSEWYIIPL